MKYAILFYLRTSKQRKDNKAPIYMRITVDGDRTEYSTGEYVEPKYWSNKTYRVHKRHDSSEEINNHLQHLENKVKEARNYLEQIDQTITAKAIKAELLDERKSEIMFMKRFKHHLGYVEDLVGIDFARGTFVKYRSAYRHMKAFLNSNKINDLPINKIDLKFIEEFEKFMKTERDCNHNTTLKYIYVFKKIVLRAFNEGIIKSNPFANYNRSYKSTEPTHLSWGELKRIEGKNFGAKSLNRVRDVFVFCCYTGLAFSDAESLKYANFFEDKQGDLWMIKKRTKTEEPARILLLPKAIEIFEKYRDYETAWIDQDQVLPTISNTRTNAYLKDIAELCDIEKRLTTHVARHTFATTVTLDNGIPLESVQKMLGHKSRKSTEQYAKVTTFKLGKEMKNLRNRLDA